MWVLPRVSSSGQCPAVNISGAWKLDIARANYGNDPDRYAVYAVFGPGGVKGSKVNGEDWVPLVEVAIPNGNQADGLLRAQVEVNTIMDALRRGVAVLDLDSRS